MAATSLETPIRELLFRGTVIPAHPLALDEDGRFDEQHQRALSRYYLAAGAGGLAVAVHSTQFAIRDPAVGLLQPVLELAAEVIRDEKAARPVVGVAGVCGPTAQAVNEAELAARLGYDAVLLSMAGLDAHDEEALLARTASVAEVLPLFGFYLQPAVGGRRLSRRFWTRFAQLPGVVAIKIAPFDRYLTLDVARAVHEAGRTQQIALYTGNDDNIVADLLTEMVFDHDGGSVPVRIAGGLLGQWGVWTRRAVEILPRILAARDGRVDAHAELLRVGAQLTEANAAIFDASHHFRGCVPGINEVLRRQGLLASGRCLDPSETLSPGQAEEITRVSRAYPHLTDDDFVAEHLAEWLA